MLVWREVGRNEWVTALRAALAMGRQLPEPPPGAPGPFQLANAHYVRRILADAGFVAVELEAVDEPVYLGANVDDAFAFVRTMGMVLGLTHDLDEHTRRQALERLHDALAAYETDEGVLLGASAWLVTARRR